MFQTKIFTLSRKKCGFFDFFEIALPLVMASAGHAINMFFDRMMLAWYSDMAFNAAFPSGLTSFALSCFFVGTIGYVGSFVAQYTGAGVERRAGVSIWQAIWLSCIGGLILATGCFWGDALFNAIGHEPEVRSLEIVYFKYLSAFAVLPLLLGALSSFWGGRGKTWPVMIVNLVVVLVNIPVNYLLIFGKFGFPELGIEGAAIGTVFSAFVGTVIFFCMFFEKKCRKDFASWPPSFDMPLLWRLLKFGSPNGIQLFLDLLSFNIFIMLMGKVGVSPEENIMIQKASTIAFTLYTIAFTPMIGIGQTVSILVGQSVGARELANARRAVVTGTVITASYMLFMGAFFIGYPDPLINLFVENGSVMAPAALDMSYLFLRFLAAYTFFDGMMIVFSSAIKGAGDTRFAMYAGVGMAWLLFVLPCLIAYRFDAGVRTYWYIIGCYIVLCAAVFYLRYRNGAWRGMRVIEDHFIDDTPCA